MVWKERNVGDSFERLSTEGGSLSFTPSPASFFTPSNERELDQHDLDISSGGVMVIPAQAGTTTLYLIVGSGKDVGIRLLNRDSLGGSTGRSDARLPKNMAFSIPNSGSWPMDAVLV
jgi:hypothetical protein